jgi:hypothetical protein
MKLLKNKDAVSVAVGYILFSAIFLIFYVLVLINANGLLIEGPSNIVVKEQFRDIGNMMSTMITDMYMIAPENGHIETTYLIPAEVGRETYIIDADQASIDQIIEVTSTESDKSVSVTINGIASTLPINGTAYSSMSNHRISYDSRRE